MTANAQAGGPVKERKTKILTFIGALVVFITFIVKDVVLERKKDSASLLAAANSTYSSRQEFRRLNQSVGSCGAMLVRIQSRLDSESSGAKNEVSVDMLAIWQTRVFQLGQWRELEVQERNDLRELNGKLPNACQLADAEFAEFNAAFKQFDAQLATVQGNPEDMVKDRRAAFQRMDEMDKLASQVGDASLSLAGKVSERARHATERAESTLEIVTWCSYVLYAIGWFLALIGHVGGAGSE